MSRASRNSMTSTFLLILLGLAALYGGTSSLIILIPAAFLVYTAPVLRSGRD
jgi:hypothetical protein